MIMAFVVMTLVMAVVVTLCIGALALLNVVLNPPGLSVKTAQQTAVETVRFIGSDLRVAPTQDFAADSVTLTAVPQ